MTMMMMMMMMNTGCFLHSKTTLPAFLVSLSAAPPPTCQWIFVAAHDTGFCGSKQDLATVGQRQGRDQDLRIQLPTDLCAGPL